MNTINLILQAKNDVGKTYIALILAEYFQSKGSKFCAYDTENSKNSLTTFSGLKVEPVELLDKNPAAFQMEFGKFFDMVIAKNEGAVIDNGADIFEPIVQYFVKNWDDKLIAENTKEIIFHTVIAGSDRLDDTINGLVTLCNKLPHKIKIVVWLNEYFGPIEVAGKPFEEFKIYENNREKIHGIIKIRKRDSDVFKADLHKKNTLKMTLSEAIKSEEFSEVSSRRFEEFQRELFENLGIVFAQSVALKVKPITKEISGKETASEAAKKMAERQDKNLNEAALSKLADEIKKTFENHLNQLEMANAMQLSEASNRAEIVITQAAEYLTKQLNRAADGIAASTSNMLAMQTLEVNKAAGEARRARNWTVFINSITLVLLTVLAVTKLIS